MFDERSRYYEIEEATYVLREDFEVKYKRRRFLPRGEKIPTFALVTVAPEDRLDRLTAASLGDPEQYWRVCDANNAMNPFDLTAEIGVTVRVPMPGSYATQ